MLHETARLVVTTCTSRSHIWPLDSSFARGECVENSDFITILRGRKNTQRRFTAPLRSKEWRGADPGNSCEMA
jgi:hypothetical protein